MKIIAWSLGFATVFAASALSFLALSPSAMADNRPAKMPDLAKAKPMRLPVNPRPMPNFVDMAIEAAKHSSSFYPGRVFRGSDGDDKQSRVRFAQPDPVVAAPVATGGSVGPQDYGTGGQPYTMARTPGATNVPYREAGLLFFDTGQLTTCSAALVKPGILVTAAHCLKAFGSANYYANFVYLPAYNQNPSTYGVWNAEKPLVLPSWTNGTDSCSTPGKVCQDDIGVLTLVPQNGTYLGAQTGYFGYSTNNYSYKSGQAEITQLGYASGYDSGATMLRVDSQGSAATARQSLNTIIGSPLGDGSDGGPWVVNLGPQSLLTTTSWSYGQAYQRNIMVGVTSWTTGGSNPPPGKDPAQKQAGASPFRAGNIGQLVTDACNATPDAC